jgi:hypothetical protein
LDFEGLIVGNDETAISNGSASVISNPAPFFEFFSVDLGRTSTSANNLSINVVLDLFGGGTTNTVVSLQAGAATVFASDFGVPAPTGSLQVTRVQFTSFIPATAFAFAAPDSISAFSFAGDGYGYEDDHPGKGNNKGNKGKGYGNYCTGNQGNSKKVGCAKGDGYYYDDPVGDTTFYVDNLSYSAVPEPTSILGLLVASGGMAALKRKMGKKTAKKDETLV